MNMIPYAVLVVILGGYFEDYSTITPFFMVAIGFFIHRNSSTNLAAVSIYIFFYSLTLVPHMMLEETEWIFIWNVMNASAMCMLMYLTLSKATWLVLFVILSEFVLAIFNSALFVSYNAYQDGIYQFCLAMTDYIIMVQWALLWITDDGIRRFAGLYDIIVKHLLARKTIRVRSS